MRPRPTGSASDRAGTTDGGLGARAGRARARRGRGDLRAPVGHAGHRRDAVRRVRPAGRAGALAGIDVSSSSGTVRTLAEATLALVLFCDASRIDLKHLRRAVGVPLRLLGIGLPLTIALGAIAAASIFGVLSFWEAVILGVVLAPTDAALGQAVVSDERVPERIRQGLNVESGLNDGICVPLLFAAVAAADIESEISGGRSAATLLVEELGYGALGGVVAGLLIALLADPRRPARPDRGRVAAGDPGRRRRARLRDRDRAARLRLHRGVRGRRGVPRRLPARSRSAQRPRRAARDHPQRHHVRALRRDPARPGADAADLGARAVRRAQPHAGADAPGRGRDARLGRAARHDRLPRLVRASRLGLDRVRGDRDRGVAAAQRRRC